MEYSLHEIGLGGTAALQKYWLTSVQEYALRLEQEDKQMIQDYHMIAVSYTGYWSYLVFLKSHFFRVRIKEYRNK